MGQLDHIPLKVSNCQLRGSLIHINWLVGTWYILHLVSA